MNDKNSDFSVVMPIHNEAELLVLSLPSVILLNPKELILLFDNCSDNSYEVAVQITKRMNYFEKTSFELVSKEEGSEFSFRPTFLRRKGYLKAKSSKILKTDADLILDQKIKKYIPLLGKNDIRIINFEFLDFPISYRHMIKRFLEKLRIPLPQSERWLGGNVLFFLEDWKKAFNERQNDQKRRIDLSKVARGEDTLFHKLLLLEKHKSIIILTKTLHLRPVESPRRHYLRGQISWNVAHRSFLIVLAQAIIFNRLKMVKGYLDARKGIDQTNSMKS